MIINKSQNQSLNLMEVNLQTSFFSHRYFYVTLFKVTDMSKLVLLFKKDASQKTENVVYSEVLLSN